MKTIASRHNPMVHVFRDLAAEPDESRVLLDGVHLVRDAAAAGLAFEQVCVSTSALERGTDAGLLAAALEARGLPILVAPDQLFAAISPVRTPAGIVAIVRRSATTPQEICQTGGVPPAFILAGTDVQDPGNVGALLRVAEAAGTTGAVIAGSSANPFSWKALRGSMGSALRLPVVHGQRIGDLVPMFKAASIRTIAAVARDGASPDEIDWTGRVAVIVGGEGPGLAPDVVEASDVRVTIPMAPPVESLNVAVAAAILLYAARRQRT
ncbi:MAG TPA: RNA methyltransferase [Vicinamibacterales bacterium]|nr:RNA methyltransferase [Vicinamibacterales bacterium]